MKIRAIIPAVLAAGLIYVASASSASAFGLLDRVMYGGDPGCCAEAKCAVEPSCCTPEPTCCGPRRHHRRHWLKNNCCEPKCEVVVEPKCCAPEPTCCGPRRHRHRRHWFKGGCCEPTCEVTCGVVEGKAPAQPVPAK